ncbi:MAG: hypothetical protein E7485_01825 [Ruminococcaceae bacterium]|nr:hypothetical protein [Oscillospiraceae bacterium]
MIKTISKSKARSRKMKLRVFLRWTFYSVLLLLFYLWETNPLFVRFSPLLIIPLATAVAMYEGELAAGVFGVVCGLMIDMASGTILGFSSLWLLVLCPLISLLARFYIRISFVSHLALNFAASFIMACLDVLFKHWVWEESGTSITFVNTVLPAYLGAVIGAVPVYFLVRLISMKLRPAETRRPEESSLTAEDAADKVRE